MLRKTFLSISFVALASCHVSPAPKHEPLSPTDTAKPANLPWGKISERARIVAVGDTLMHFDVKKSAQEAATRGVGNQGFDNLWQHVKAQVSDADWALANLETPIAPKNDLGSRAYMFNAPVAMLQSLKDTGFDMVSFANNHAYDQGRAGFVETLEHLSATGLGVIGAGENCAAAEQAKIVELNSIRVAFIGSSQVFNNQLNRGRNAHCVADYKRENMLASIASAKSAGADAIVLSIHWGAEDVIKPLAQTISEAHLLMDAGVDVIIGHHPHVLQPIEAYETRDGRVAAVIYSLGNFVSNQSRFYRAGVSQLSIGDQRDGALVQFDFVRKNHADIGARIEVANLKVTPLWTENNWVARQAGKTSQTNIRVVDLDQRIIELETELESSSQANRLSLQRELDNLADRRRRIEAVIGYGWLNRD